MKKNDKVEEQVTDIKGTIVGFVEPDPVEKSQEEEIQAFRVKRQKEAEVQEMTEEAKKRKEMQYEEEEEKLERVKAELLQSLKVRIPKIEAKFKIVEPKAKKRKVVEKVSSKGIQHKNVQSTDEKEEKSTQKINDEKERE